MIDIPFPEGSFELVTCISAIERLDGVTRSRRVITVTAPTRGVRSRR